jgi:ketosteroid isomerase-like protein
MSHDNVAVVRRTARLFEAGDMDGLGRVYDLEAVLWHAEGCGGSGVLTDRPVSGAYRVRQGRITEVRFYWDHQEALDAAGEVHA